MAALSSLALPTGARGRGLALLVTLLGAAALWLGVISPLLELYAANAETIAQRQALAGRMQDLADALPALRRQAESAQPKDAPATALLEGSGDAVAAATLQGLLETMCGASGVKVTSAEALPAEQAGAYRRIGLRVSVDAKWVQLSHLLRAIAQATPRIFVDDLQLHAQPTAEQARELPLDISMTLLAFRLPGAAATAEAPAADAATPDVPGTAPAVPAPSVAPSGVASPGVASPSVTAAPDNATVVAPPDPPPAAAPATP